MASWTTVIGRWVPLLLDRWAPPGALRMHYLPRLTGGGSPRTQDLARSEGPIAYGGRYDQGLLSQRRLDVGLLPWSGGDYRRSRGNKELVGSETHPGIRPQGRRTEMRHARHIAFCRPRCGKGNQ